jgi:hypothetical protein
MKGPSAFWIIFTLLAALPLVLVGLFAVARRFPPGLPPHRQWILSAAAASIYVLASVSRLIEGEVGRGLLLLASAIIWAVGALIMRKRPVGGATRLADR